MATPVNSRKGAALIEAQTNRDCSRQNLETHCKTGALKSSQCIMRKKPLLLDSDLLVGEFLALVAPNKVPTQQQQQQTAQAKQPPTTRRQFPQQPATAPEELPDYTVSRARTEYEKANLLELERKEKEGTLVYRADFELARNAVASQIINRAEVLPKQIKQAIPHLLIEEVEKIEKLVKEMLEGVASWSYDELAEE